MANSRLGNNNNSRKRSSAEISQSNDEIDEAIARHVADVIDSLRHAGSSTSPPPRTIPSPPSVNSPPPSTAPDGAAAAVNAADTSVDQSPPLAVDPSDGWADDEKQRLLDAVKIYGDQDVGRLKEAVGTRSMLDIFEFFRIHKELRTATASVPAVSNGGPSARAKRGGKQRHGILNSSGTAAPIPTESATSSSSTDLVAMMRRNSKLSPDAKLEEWQRIARLVATARKDYSASTLKKVISEKALVENVRILENAEAGGEPVDFGSFSFSRIYSHIVDAITDGRNRTKLCPRETEIVQLLLQDLGNFVRQIPNIRESKDHLGSILAAYRCNALGPPQGPRETAEPPPSVADDVLRSLNPLCIPRNLLTELPNHDTDHNAYASYRVASSSLSVSSSCDGGQRARTLSIATRDSRGD